MSRLEFFFDCSGPRAYLAFISGRPLAARAGVEVTWRPILVRRKLAATKQRLRANIDELITRAGFRSPTLFLDGDDMSFGNDRLPFAQAALAGRGGLAP